MKARTMLLCLIMIGLQSFSQNDTCELIVPSIMTLVKEGASDEFKVASNCEFEAYDLKVYNRWESYASNQPILKMAGLVQRSSLELTYGYLHITIWD